MIVAYHVWMQVLVRWLNGHTKTEGKWSTCNEIGVSGNTGHAQDCKACSIVYSFFGVKATTQNDSSTLSITRLITAPVAMTFELLIHRSPGANLASTSSVNELSLSNQWDVQHEVLN